MNSNLNRALGAALVAIGGVAPAYSQFDYDARCIDRAATAPYSVDFLFGRKENALFGAGIGFSGTVAYAQSTECGAATAPTRGRIGFTIGPVGSIQDTADAAGFDNLTDNFLRLTRGTNFGEDIGPLNSYGGPYLTPASGGISYARVFVRTTGDTPTTTNFLYGINPLNLAFEGPRSRYIYTESRVNGTDPTNSIGVRCVIDVLADAARVNWRLTNNLSAGTPVGLGLWFGQYVQLRDRFGIDHTVHYGDTFDGFDTTYITVPGRRPLSVQERFNNTGLAADPAQDATVGVPRFVNFSMSQTAGFGLQVVNSPDALQGFDPTSTIDQTQVDEFAVGDPTFLIDGRFGTTDPQFGDFIFNAAGNGVADAASIFPFPSYLQKWQPTTFVPANGFRDIIAYYRSTSGDSSYSPSFQGYSAVVDTPKAVSTNRDDPTEYTNNPFTIRVNVDNTGGFSNNDALVRMESVQVVLNLPDGMHAPGNPAATTITKTVNRTYVRTFDPQTGLPVTLEASSPTIQPASIGFVDFQVAVDEDVFGALPYTATITPQPGFASKTINGTINVAATPRLLVTTGPNLVSPPWTFTDNSWSSILNLDLNEQFKAFTFDAQIQQYVPQTGAERGRGTFIVSNLDLQSRQLGGNPRQPTDQFPDANNYDAGGAPLVRLYQGWNLVGNPYNYALPLGQIIGVPIGSNNLALSYSELVNQGYTDGSFAFYDQSLRSYNFISGADDRLQPNFGYWIYANQAFDIQFPPLFELFIRGAKSKPAAQRFDNWKLQLSAATPNAADTQNFVGIVRNPADATRLRVRKAPVPPTKDAIRAYVKDGSLELAQSMRGTRGKQTFGYNVYSKSAGPVAVSWPNLKSIPSNLSVSVYDPVARKTVNARSVAGYNYTAGAETVRQFTVTVTPQGTVAQRIGSTSATTVKMGNVKAVKVAYALSGRGSASVRVLKGKKSLGTVVSDVDAVAGNNSFVWPMIDGNAQPLPNGSYILEIAATGEGGDTATRQIAVTVNR